VFVRPTIPKRSRFGGGGGGAGEGTGAGGVGGREKQDRSAEE
jgi:hypothetical protein